MKLILNNIRIPLEKYGPEEYRFAAAQKMGADPGAIRIIKILSKAIELKDVDQFYYILSVAVHVEDGYVNRSDFAVYSGDVETVRQQVLFTEKPIVVGFGPAGMFAALELIAHGLKPVIFERGKKIEERAADVQSFIREKTLNPESNIQFGEGGAGSFSDGKLFSRRNNNTSIVNRVLKTFVRFGAPAEIEYISKPHLGTDILCKIVRNIRNHILESGGEIHYSSRMTDLLIANNKASGVVINGEQECLASGIFLALGHSARDTFKMLHQKGVAVEQRPISVGVRVEHPVKIIDRMRYGDKYCNSSLLGAATYSINHTNRKIKRGVYTFCMCPGGEVVNASSSAGKLVLNGMSYSQRSSPFSNAALVVSCHTADYGSESPLAGIAFQEGIERKAFSAGGGDWNVPAQNLMSFLGRSPGGTLHETSYKMGTTPAELRDIFPQFVVKELLAAFSKWENEVPLFISQEAVVMAAETRTSSPVRITRNEKYESITVENLYPIGEGAGYTGGITSSAADGIRSVEAYVIAKNKAREGGKANAQ